MSRKELPALYSIRMRAFLEQKHLAGGEDIVDTSALPTRILELFDQGMSTSSKNPLAPPHSINIRIDPVHMEEIRNIPLLPVFCLQSTSHEKTWAFLTKAFERMEAIFGTPAMATHRHARDLLSKDHTTLSGASLLLSGGEHLTPDGTGIRVTHFGIRPGLRTELMQESAVHLAGSGRRFIEALQISSKILSHQETAFELCLSDNPDYTTGYLSVRGVGYIRLPFLKHPGLPSGGRIIGIRKSFDQATLSEIIHYLTEVPVLFTSRNPLHPPENDDELLSRFQATDG